MKVIVLGAGVIGVSTAYYLAKAGHDVTVIDRQSGVGLEASFANGGQIAVSHATPWARPGLPLQLLKWMGQDDAPFYFRLKLDPHFWMWGLRFLASCTTRQLEIGTERLFRLSQYSLACLKDLRDTVNLDYNQRQEGILSVYRDQQAFDLAAAELVAHGGAEIVAQALDSDGCRRVEPALKTTGIDIAGGILTAEDESGDAFAYTEQLADLCKGLGVEFRFGATVLGFDTDSSSITGIRLKDTDQTLSADAFVLALGSYSPLLARALGLKLPVYPVKGYSVTIPVTNQSAAPTISMSDVQRRISMSRLGNQLRAAGTAEIAGYDVSLSDGRCQNVLDGVKDLFPQAGDTSQAKFWTALRPMTPDGPPIIGGSSYRNLFLNTGHGTLGWTMATGSGKIVADLISGQRPEISLDGMTMARYE